MILSVLPSYAASEGRVKVNEKWILETETAIQVQKVDYRLLEKTSTVMEDAEVEEIHLTVTGESMALGEEITLDRTVNAKTRIRYCWQNMQAGNQIPVVAKCSDNSIVYRIGMKVM